MFNKKGKNNILNFNLYVLMSTFARDLIELFVGLILYKNGFSLKTIILFYVFIYAFSIMLCYPLVKLGKKTSNKVSTMVSVLAYGIFLYYLSNVKISIFYILTISFFYSLYRSGYWISRRYYNFRVIKKNDIAVNSSIVSITNQLAKIVAVYISSIFLETVSTEVLTSIASLIYAFSLIPLSKIEFEHDKNNTKINIPSTFKKLNFQNIYMIGSYELVKMVQFLIPLYLYIYIEKSFKIVGIMGVYTNVSMLIFAYLYGKSVDKNKNMLQLSVLLTVFAYALKINVFGIALILISFMEGIVTRMYDVSISNEVFHLSKKFEYNNYNLAYELILNLFRMGACVILYLFVADVKVMIYVLLLFIIIGVLLKFKQPDLKDYLYEKK